jgi:hypothetical protein
VHVRRAFVDVQQSGDDLAARLVRADVGMRRVTVARIIVPATPVENARRSRRALSR